MAPSLFGVLAAAAATSLLGLGAGPGLANAQSSIATGYNITFNWTLNDMDAQIQFFPDSTSPSPPKGFLWNTTFSDSPWSTYLPGQNGLGESVHVASAPLDLDLSPRVQVQFIGTGIYINGWVNVTNDDWTDPPISFQVDSQVTDYHQSPPRPVLVSAINLPWGYHNCTLWLNRGTIHLDNITLITGMANTAFDFDFVDCNVVNTVNSNGSLNPEFQYSGTWNTSSQIGYIAPSNVTANNSTGNNATASSTTGNNATAKAAMPVAQNGTNMTAQTSMFYPEVVGVPGSSIFIPIPANTSFIALNGSTGPKHGHFILHWNTPPPNTQNDMALTMWSMWSNSAVLYQVPLDPLVLYNLTLYVSNDTNLADGVISLNSVTYYPYYSSNAPTSWDYGDGPNKGAIAGGVVGGVVGVALIAALAYYFGRRRRDAREAQAPIEQATAEKLDSVDGSRVDLGSSSTSMHGSQPPSPVDGRGPTGPPVVVANAAQHLLPIHENEPPLSPAGGATTRVSPWATQPPGTDAVPYVVAKAETLAYLESHSGSTPTTRTASPTVASFPSTSSKSVPPRPPPLRTRIVEQEQDAGAIDLEPELVPPVYNPEWAQARSPGSTPTVSSPTSGLPEAEPSLATATSPISPTSPVTLTSPVTAVSPVIATSPEITSEPAAAPETETHETEEAAAGPGPSSS